MAGKPTIIGISELQRKFIKLGDDMKLRTARRMVAAAGGVLRKEAKNIAQSKGLKKSGALIRNIAIKRERNAPPGIEQYHLGVRHGRALGNGKKVIKYFELSKRSGRIVIRRKDDPFYWWFLEFGHKIVGRATGDTRVGYTYFKRKDSNKLLERKFSHDSLTGRRRNPTGMVEAIPFIAPALENKKGEAIAAMESRLTKDLADAQK